MGFSFIPSIISTIITIIFITKEPRRFINSILFLITIGFWIISLLEYGFIHPETPVVPIIGLIALMVPLAYIIIMFFLFFNGIKVIKKEGLSFSHCLGILLSIIMFLAPFIFILLIIINQQTGHFNLIICSGTILFYFMITFAGFFCYSLLYCLLPRDINCNYIIIHGSGLMPDGSVTPLLRARADKAIKIYRKAKSSPKLVPSGGKGTDEKTSEASAIAKYLINQGIPKDKIILEEKSTNTFENLKCVQALLNNIEGNNKYSCIFVTNNYHVFRTSLYARQLKLKAQGVGCRTAGYFLPSAFLREYIAVMKMQKIANFIFVFILIVEMLLIK